MSLDIHRSYPEQPLAWRPRLTGAPGDAVNNKLYGMEVALALCGFGDTPPPNLTTGLPASHHGYRATVVIGHCIRGDVIAMQTENCALERMGTVSVILDTQALAKQAGCGNQISLTSLHARCFDTTFEHPHNSGNDAIATLRCFFALVEAYANKHGLARKHPMADVLFAAFDLEWKDGASHDIEPGEIVTTEIGICTADARKFSSMRSCEDWLFTRNYNAHHALVSEYRHYHNKGWPRRGRNPRAAARSFPRSFIGKNGTTFLSNTRASPGQYPNDWANWVVRRFEVYDREPNFGPLRMPEPTGLPANNLYDFADDHVMLDDDDEDLESTIFTPPETVVSDGDSTTIFTPAPSEMDVDEPVENAGMRAGFVRPAEDTGLPAPPGVRRTAESYRNQDRIDSNRELGSRMLEWAHSYNCTAAHNCEWRDVGDTNVVSCEIKEEHNPDLQCPSKTYCSQVLECTRCGMRVCRRCHQLMKPQHSMRQDQRRRNRGLQGYERRGELPPNARN